MRAEKVPEFGGDGTGDHEVVNRHQLVDTGIVPVDGYITLTCGAVAVAAGSEDPIDVGTVFTGADDRSQRFGSTLDDCPYHFFVIGWHSLFKGVQIRFAVGEEHITYGYSRIRS